VIVSSEGAEAQSKHIEIAWVQGPRRRCDIAAVNAPKDKSTPVALVPEVVGNEMVPSWFVVPCSKMFSFIVAWAPRDASPIEQANPKTAPYKSFAAITRSPTLWINHT